MNDNTERQRLHALGQERSQELGQDLGFLRSVLDSSADCIKVLDRDAKVTFISACGQMLMEVSDINDVVGRAWPELWAGEAREQALQALATARSGGLGRFTAPRKTLAGTPKWWDVRVSAIARAEGTSGSVGTPDQFLCVSTDITEVHRGIEALALSEARLVTALRASGVVGLWNWDLKTGAIYGDANFARLWDVTEAQAHAGMTIADFTPKFHPEDAPFIEEKLQRTFNDEEEFSSEYRVVRPSGSARWISARGRVLRDAQGANAQFSGTSVDITDQKLFEFRQVFLLNLSDSLRLLTDANAVLAAVADALGRHLRADRLGFARMLPDGNSMVFEGGYSPECAVVHGTYPLTCFGSQHAARLRNGLTLVCDDASLDLDTHTHTRPGTNTNSASQPDSRFDIGYSAHWDELAVLAFVVVPQLRSGQLHAMLYAHSREVRVWSPDDIALTADVAARAWEALERVRAETALRDSEKRLSTAVKITSLATFQWDTGTDAMYLSARGREIFGFDDDQAVSANDMFARMHPHDVQRVQAESAIAARDASALETTYRVVRPDGSVCWVRSVNDALTSLPGQAVQQVGVFEDVTERVLADQTLRTSELQFRTLAQSLPHQVWTAQPRGRIDWLNERVCEFFGEPSAALLATNFAGKVHPEDLPGVVTLWREVLPQGLPFKYELRLKRSDGVYRWHIARAEALRGEDGHIKRWVGTSTDIEDQHIARELLRNTNSDLEARVASQARDRDRAWKNSIDLQVIVGADGIIRSANDAWFTLLGWRPDEVVGHHHLEFSAPEDRRPNEDILAVGFVTAVSLYENRMRHAEGGFRWVAWAIAPEGDLVYASGRHITAEKQAAADLHAAQSQLRQSQKMEAVGQLTGGVAHDFNNLLQVISANLQLMGKHAADSDKWRSRLSGAEDAVRRGAKLASQLLAFSRQQALEPKVINVGRFVLGMEDLIRRSMGDAVEIQTQVAPGAWNALLDLGQIENALLNLAINARDAMQGSGTLTLAVTNEQLLSRVSSDRPEWADLTDIPPGDYVKLAVTDTGTGMTAEVMAQIFEPFFTTKAVGSGTGLGLSMVYGFVKQSGGHVQVRSTVGQGTTMALYLPRATQAEATLAVAPHGPVVGGTETILVAEDDAGVRATLVELLADLGYQVLHAENADRALEVIHHSLIHPNDNQRIDLLLTDVVMPGQLKSVELVRLAKQVLPGLAVLYTSGYAANVLAPNDRNEAEVEMLSKPYTRETLARKVRQVLDKRSLSREAT